MSHERFRRTDPERTGPVRSFWTTFRSSDAWDETDEEESWAEPPEWMEDEEPFGTAGGSAEDSGSGGVRLGYDLLAEQTLRGQRVAQQLTSAFGSSADDLQKIMERMIRFYGNMYTESAAFWLDLLCSSGLPKLPTPLPVRHPIRVIVTPQQRGSAILQLRPGAERLPLFALQLWSRDPMKPPLTDIKFAREGGRTVLRITISDNQPPAIYLGVVCHAETSRPLGTVAVRVRGV